MRTKLLPLLSVIICTLAPSLPAHAQATGLRLKEHSNGLALHSTQSGLKLSFKQLDLGGADAFSSQSSSTASIFRNELRADWPMNRHGLQPSIGLSWNSSGLSSNSGLSNSLSAKTFLGLDWFPSQHKQQRWSLSAELGTALGGSNPCSYQRPSCAPTGLNPQLSGSGLRLNPYLNFGATYRFGR